MTLGRNGSGVCKAGAHSVLEALFKKKEREREQKQNTNKI
jgi:hypothetical protein